MKRLLATSLGQFRIVSLAEGISYLLLLGFGMPMKYMMGEPVFVSIFGSIHGALFIFFMVALIRAAIDIPWRLGRVLVAFIASIIPFGAFFLEMSLRREMEDLYGPDGEGMAG
ncbi:MAG: DUF3817 domain-containing protein [Acidobacteriota bacterium]|nr:DUF3817 domain-containing protein [Acidobacteriota bacterium]